VLVETDAPYLTPMPWRGRPNASYLIPHTVRAVAAVLEMAEAELCRALAGNTAAAFGHPWGGSTTG
jgi:TatD DNase family protein